MSSPPFQFKQFVVHQDKAALKVNTDGVLLGAWAKGGEPKRVLDVGTGTGVIALMMAQKYPNAQVDALEIDRPSAEQAAGNFFLTEWRERMAVYHAPLQDFNSAQTYDFIISNPPYFVNDLKPTDARKSAAKHSVDLTYDELLFHADRLLGPNGRLALVIPYFSKNMFLEMAMDFQLFAKEIVAVRAREDKPPYLSLLLLEKCNEEPFVNELVIQNKKNQFTAEYKRLTRDFYLKF